MKYAELLAFPAHLPWLKTAIRRVLIYGSAAVVAIVISGGIFSLTPVVGVSLVHTQGTSMEPAQKDGDVVLLQDIKGAEARVGDVVVFEERGHGIMHRVIQRYTNEQGELVLVTQGDNVPVPDHPIQASQVRARKLVELPLLGDLSRLIHAQGGFYTYRSIVITGAVLVIALWGLNASAKAERRSPGPPDASTPDGAGPA